MLETADERLVTFALDGEIRVHRTPDDPPELSLLAAALPLNAVMFYRHMLDRAGTFDPTLWILEDYEYLLRLEAKAAIAFSSALTLELHVDLRPTGPLGALLPRYLETLDVVYAAHPASPEIARRPRSAPERRRGRDRERRRTGARSRPRGAARRNAVRSRGRSYIFAMIWAALTGFGKILYWVAMSKTGCTRSGVSDVA